MSIFGVYDERNYSETRAAAQAYANKYGRDVGLERNDLFKTYALFLLPSPQNRYGHELRCEVVRSEKGAHQ
jgi:hypothetical protein